MRILVTFEAPQPVRLPTAYNALVQGMIYHNLSSRIATFLHEQGFVVGNRNYKLFTFSRLMGQNKVTGGTIVLSSPFSLIISSPWDEFIESLADTLQRKQFVTLGATSVAVQSIMVEYSQSFSERLTINMLSPMTAYSTFTLADGRSKTYYYSPFERDFALNLGANLGKKFEAIHGVPHADPAISVKPLGVTDKNQKTLIYKGFVIKGWLGRYQLEGDPELLRVGYDVGLGSKNSQGLGCYELVA